MPAGWSAGCQVVGGGCSPAGDRQSGVPLVFLRWREFLARFNPDRHNRSWAAASGAVAAPGASANPARISATVHPLASSDAT